MLQILADHVYSESQCGSRAGRSTMDMIFSLWQLQGQPLYIKSIDLTKAFDLVSRKGLFSLLKKIGCQLKLCSMVVSFHTNIKGTILFDGSTSEPFFINSGVKQDRCWRQPFSGSSSPCCCPMPLTCLLTSTTCTPDLTGSCSAWHDCMQR